MASVSAEDRERVEFLLNIVEEHWSDVSNVAAEFDSMDSTEREDYLVDECVSADRLRAELDRFVSNGKLDDFQMRRYHYIEQLTSQNSGLRESLFG